MYYVCNKEINNVTQCVVSYEKHGNKLIELFTYTCMKMCFFYYIFINV